MRDLTLLAIDSSTDNTSLAIARNEEVLIIAAWYCHQNHSVELMPNINRLLEQAGIDIKSIDGVVVARGPGSFNGLRIGISTAKGIAFGLGAPIVGISTLEAAAYQYAETGLPICPIVNAGRGEITTALYQQKDGEWQQLTVEHITTVSDLCNKTNNETIFCGEPAPPIIDDLTAKLGHKAIIPPPAGLHRAVFLAALGLKQIQSGNCDQLSTLQPIYLRRPQITQPKNKNWVAKPMDRHE